MKPVPSGWADDPVRLHDETEDVVRPVRDPIKGEVWASLAREELK